MRGMSYARHQIRSISVVLETSFQKLRGIKVVRSEDCADRAVIAFLLLSTIKCRLGQ